MGKKEKRKMREKNENEKRKVLEGKIRFQREEVKFLCCCCLTAADVFQKVVFKHRTTHYRSKTKVSEEATNKRESVACCPSIRPRRFF